MHSVSDRICQNGAAPNETCVPHLTTEPTAKIVRLEDPSEKFIFVDTTGLVDVDFLIHSRSNDSTVICRAKPYAPSDA